MTNPPTDYKALAAELAQALDRAEDHGYEINDYIDKERRELLSRAEVKALLEDSNANT